jgi:hypothetical protein
MDMIAKPCEDKELKEEANVRVVIRGGIHIGADLE